MKHIKPEATQMKAQDLGMPLDKLFSKKLDRLAACYRWNDDTRAEYERIVERIAQVIKELKGERSFPLSWSSCWPMAISGRICRAFCGMAG